jgi:hypothetical protein
MGPSFQLLELEEEDELEENSLGEAKRRNLPLSLGVQSQGTPGGKSKSRTSSGCNKSPTRGQTKTGNHHANVKELDLGLVEATPSIFHTEQAHTNRSNTKTNIKCLEKNPNWKSFWR